MEKKSFKLPMNLQFFAEEEGPAEQPSAETKNPEEEKPEVAKRRESRSERRE